MDLFLAGAAFSSVEQTLRGLLFPKLEKLLEHSLKNRMNIFTQDGTYDFVIRDGELWTCCVAGFVGVSNEHGDLEFFEIPDHVISEGLSQLLEEYEGLVYWIDECMKRFGLSDEK